MPAPAGIDSVVVFTGAGIMPAPARIDSVVVSAIAGIDSVWSFLQVQAS